MAEFIALLGKGTKDAAYLDVVKRWKLKRNPAFPANDAMRDRNLGVEVIAERGEVTSVGFSPQWRGTGVDDLRIGAARRSLSLWQGEPQHGHLIVERPPLRWAIAFEAGAVWSVGVALLDVFNEEREPGTPTRKKR